MEVFQSYSKKNFYKMDLKSGFWLNSNSKFSGMNEYLDLDRSINNFM